MKRPAVFFDRDNTLIANNGYLGDPKGVVLVAGAADAIARARELGFAVITFSNQSGVARGMFTEEAVHAVNARLDELLQDQDPQALIDRHEFCPYHPDAVVDRYKADSDLRKPRPGMLLQAAQRLGLDLSRSWVIGDAARDVEAGMAAFCRTILFTDPALLPSPDAGDLESVMPDFTAASLKEALDIIENHSAEDEASDESETSEPQAEKIPQAAPVESAPNVSNESESNSMKDASADVTSSSDDESHATATASPASSTETGVTSAPRKMTFAERVRAGTFQPARVAGGAEPQVDKPRRAAIPLAAAESPTPTADAPTPATTIATAPDVPAPETPIVRPSVKATEPVPLGEQIEPLLQQIIEELRQTREQPYDEFSVSKLLAGIMQVLVIPVLFMAYLHHSTPLDAHSFLLLAIFLQTLTIALLVMGRQR